MNPFKVGDIVDLANVQSATTKGKILKFNDNGTAVIEFFQYPIYTGNVILNEYSLSDVTLNGKLSYGNRNFQTVKEYLELDNE